MEEGRATKCARPKGKKGRINGAALKEGKKERGGAGEIVKNSFRPSLPSRLHPPLSLLPLSPLT